MHTIKQSSANVVASDTQASVNAIDQAMLTQSRLFSTVVETAAESKLPVGTAQKLLQNLTTSMAGLVASRADMVTAVSQINLIQMRSNLNATSFGCPKVVEPDGNGVSRPAGQQELTPEQA